MNPPRLAWPLRVTSILLPLLFASHALADDPPRLQSAVIDGSGPDWAAPAEKDFENINGASDTWSWKGDVVHSTGKPTGVLCTGKTYVNFEFVAEWRHLTPGGNSGIIVWVPDEALKGLKPGALPGYGIETQVLDHGYTRQFIEQTGEKADWFTTDGDIIPVGKSRMKPFQPTSPDGSRSFPRKHLSKGFGHWNHYYARAINGEVRLWVNGQEVSGANSVEPHAGRFCLEAEGAPIDFRHIRIRELP